MDRDAGPAWCSGELAEVEGTGSAGVCDRIVVVGLHRRSAKVLFLDPDGRVLLFSGGDPGEPSRPPIWFPVGGGVDPGETLEEAAVREVKEETGRVIDDLGPVVMTRHVEFTFDGTSYDQDETYFAVRTEAFLPDPSGWTETERRVMACSRWWTLDDLRGTDETVYPEGLAELVSELLGVQDFNRTGETGAPG